MPGERIVLTGAPGAGKSTLVGVLAGTMSRAGGDLRLDGLPIEQAGAEMVGAGGWQLSQGERSLVYLAHALLRRPRVLLLDGATAALDPPAAARALAVACGRAEAVLMTR